jgi:translation initiation factor IF-3
MIRVPMLRVIGANGEQMGIISLDEAMRAAREATLDLVEVAPMADPPVAKIMDYGKFRYQQEKKAKESKKKTHTVTIKEIKLRPKIGQNDLDVKKKQILEFLAEGNKVKLTLQFRGRELAYTELGKKVVDQLVKELEDVAVPDMDAKLEGKSMGLMLSPKKGSKPSESNREE